MGVDFCYLQQYEWTKTRYIKVTEIGRREVSPQRYSDMIKTSMKRLHNNHIIHVQLFQNKMPFFVKNSLQNKYILMVHTS